MAFPFHLKPSSGRSCSIEMASRQLPRRVARSAALENLNLRYNEADDDDQEFPQHEEDDFGELVDGETNVLDISDEEIDETAVRRESETEESSDEESGESVQEELLSPSGVNWREQPTESTHGRVPARNVFSARRGFRRGIHPESQKEAFLVIFEDIVEVATMYANLAGRRLADQWLVTDFTEMLSFIGLHILGGELFPFEFLNFRLHAILLIFCLLQER